VGLHAKHSIHAKMHSMPSISIPAWYSTYACSRSAKWARDQREGGCQLLGDSLHSAK